MAYSNPSVADFKSQFFRDFPYGTDPETSILDEDIANAFVFTNANGSVSQNLFSDQASYTLCYLLLSAHYLVMNIRSSSQGINGQFNFLQASKGAGPVNESFSIPQRVLDNPDWSILMKTNYGAQFMQLILPQLAGAVFVVGGTTQPY